MGYFRCGAEKRICSRARTGDVCSCKDWECPTKHPDCLSLREPVSFYEVHRRWISISVAAVIAVIVLFGLIQLFQTNPLARELQQVQRDFTSLDARLKDIEAQPTPRATPEGHFSRIQEWSKQAASLKAEVESALNANMPADAQRGVESLSILARNAEELALAIDGMHGKEAPKAIAAKPMLEELGTLRSSAESIEERASDDAVTDVVKGAEALLEEMRTTAGRLTRLLKKAGPPVDTSAVASLVDTIKSASTEASNALAKYIPPPTLPFKEDEATLLIGAPGDIAGTLIVPLLKSRAAGIVEKAPDARWFYSAGADKIIIARSDEGALRDLAAGRLDLAIVDRPPTREEAEAFNSVAKASLTSTTYAKTICLNALTFYAHPESTRKSITQAEISDLKYIGGSPGSPERIVAERYGVAVSSATKPLTEAVSENPDAIAVGLFHQHSAVSGLKRLAITGGPSKLSVEPNPFTISTEDYPLSFRITAHTSPKSRPSAAQFVQFCLSDAAQDLVSERGYVDIRLKPPTEPVEPAIVAAIQSAVGGASLKSITRLSTALHFDVDEDRLDYKAIADLERISPILARAHANSKIVVVGFTDSTGTPQINVPLSKRRADSVAAVLKQSGLSASTVGLGDQTHNPESNVTEEGRYRNRRANIYLVEL